MKRIEETLARDGKLYYTIKGVSMLPMLHQGRDIVVICVPEGRLKRLDVALYRRGKQYVLHRVIHVTEWGYLIRGDNTYALEKVPEQDVIGVLKAFTRKGKSCSVEDRGYLRYARFWCAVYPVRAVLISCRRRLGRIARKLGIRRPGTPKKAPEDPR